MNSANSQPEGNSGPPLLLFDGVCNLCSASVQWIIKRDAREIFRFASLQSETGLDRLKKFNLPANSLDSVVLIDKGKCYTHADAALHVARLLGGPWRLLLVFCAVPRPLRNRVYNWIANNRYRWFGKKDQCWLPTPDLRKRFV
jgi:predicted DCC family thiol-disulfide oxidoreductase YuxK